MGIDWIESHSGRKILRLSEKLNFDCHKDFRSAIRRWDSDPRKSSIEVDLAHVTFIDSSGLGLLLLLKDTVRSAGHQIAFRNGNQALCPTLRMLSLETFS